MKKVGGQFTPKLGGHFKLESGGHFKLELGGQYHWNLQYKKNKQFHFVLNKLICQFLQFYNILNLKYNFRLTILFFQSVHYQFRPLS